MIWENENKYNTFIRTASEQWNVPISLIKGIIAKESSFNPNSYKSETRINDASWGLMQLLYKTAKNLGYTGSPEGLKDPQVSIFYGTKLLAANLRQAKGNIEVAISAYNAGFSIERPWDAKRNSKGVISNQSYVNDVLVYKRYFEGGLSEEEVKKYQKTKWVKPTLLSLIPFLVIGGIVLWTR